MIRIVSDFVPFYGLIVLGGIGWLFLLIGLQCMQFAAKLNGTSERCSTIFAKLMVITGILALAGLFWWLAQHT